MKLCDFDPGGYRRIGVVAGDRVVPIRDLIDDVVDNMREAIAALAGESETVAHDIKANLSTKTGFPLDKVRLLAPIVPKRNVFCVGWNYAEHFAEGKARRPAAAVQEIPAHPALFTKNPFAIIGPEAAIRYPAPISEQLDYEVELAVVIGREGRDINERDALDHVFGYTIGNDVSVRDVQRTWHGGQWFKGKNFDTHFPLGPWIVTTDEIPDPQALRLTTRVDGVIKQDSNTKQMVFPVARIIAELSAGLTLYPGDVIMTGTPAGVGMDRTPPEWLTPGDIVELEIERIGILRNHIERST